MTEKMMNELDTAQLKEVTGGLAPGHLVFAISATNSSASTKLRSTELSSTDSTNDVSVYGTGNTMGAQTFFN